MKLLVPLKLIILLLYVKIAPPQSAELLVKLLVPLKLIIVLSLVTIAPPTPSTAELLMKLLD